MAVRQRTVSIMAAVLVALVMGAPAGAQGGPSLAPAPVGVLAEVTVDALPAPDAEIWLLRFELHPGRSLPVSLLVGPTVVVVESGELTVAPADAAAAGAGAQDTVVTTGQAVSVSEDTPLSMRNNGDDDVLLLALLTRHAGQAEAGTGSEGGEMVPTRPIGVAQASFPEGPGTITIERIALDPAATDRTEVPGGAVVGGIERGSVTLTVETGACSLLPGVGPPGAEMVGPSNLGQSDAGDLAADGGFGCWDAQVARLAGGDGATIIQARVMPDGLAAGATLANDE